MGLSQVKIKYENRGSFIPSLYQIQAVVICMLRVRLVASLFVFVWSYLYLLGKVVSFSKPHFVRATFAHDNLGQFDERVASHSHTSMMRLTACLMQWVFAVRLDYAHDCCLGYSV